MKTTYANTSIGSILDGLKQRIIHGVKGHGKRTVNNTSVELRSEVNLHHITLLQDHFVARIRGVVSGAVVDAQTAGETHATFEVVALLKTLVTGQSADGVLNTLRDLRQGLAGLDVLLRILADLTVNLGTLAILLQEVIVHAVEIAFFLVGCAIRVLILIFDDFAFGVLAVRE